MGLTPRIIDYEGVTLSSRTANSKAAASALTGIFQNHYPEFLVRVPCARFLAAPNNPNLTIYARPASFS